MYGIKSALFFLLNVEPMPKFNWHYCNRIRLIKSKMQQIKHLSLTLALITIFSFIACNKDENAPKDVRGHLTRGTTIRLYVGETATINHDGDCNWSSKEPLIASVDNNGIVTAKLVGATDIYANYDYVWRVVVQPTSTIDEPYMTWGASMTSVRRFMENNGYDYINSASDDDLLMFRDNNNDVIYMYQFENNKLNSSAIGGSITSKIEEITFFLLERYIPIYVDETQYIVYFTNIEKDLLIALAFNVSSNLMIALYAPYDYNSKTKAINFNHDLQILENCTTIKSAPIDINIVNDIINKFK